MKAVNITKKKEIADTVYVAKDLLKRMKGLLGKRVMSQGSALLIVPCKGIHTIGMQFPLDVIFLDKNNRVTSLREDLRPNRMTGFYFRAVSVLELPAGTIASTGTRIGDEIEIA